MIKYCAVLSLCLLLAGGCGGDAAGPSAPAAGEAALPEGVTLVEHFQGQGEITIPYRKYRLDNGLTVVLHEDHSDPLVHVDVTYHVGSAREEIGRSGFAHFFEHMMFQGSRNVADEEHFKIVSDAGGTLNGTTDSDRTNYFQTLPVNQLETALWLEADRMGLLLEAVTQEKFEIQRETVKNERGQRVDNQPYGRAPETVMKSLYPAGHPYSWPVIGWIEDLDRADVDDLKRFFLRWYGPNNAVLTIGGDLEPAATLQMVVKYFGPIPAGPEVERLPRQPAEIDADRYITMEDNIHLPALALGFPTVFNGHEDEAALDAAAAILGQGQDSLLYQRLVQTGRAVQTYVSHGCRELACEMFFVVIQNPSSGETLADMEAAVRDTLSEFVERGVNDQDLQKFQARFEASQVFGLQSVSGKVSRLAYFETFTGTPNGIAHDIERYLNVTADDVTRAFDRYIAARPAIILSVVPNGQEALQAAAPNFTAPEPPAAEYAADVEGDLPLRPVVDVFDRSLRPVPSANPVVELPPIDDVRLGNGVRVLAAANRETPTTTLQVVFEVGTRDEASGQAGLTALTTAMLQEATERRSAAEFAEALELLGAQLYVTPGPYLTTVTLNTLTRNLAPAVALMLERVREPRFDAADFERVKARTLEGLQQVRKSPQGLADRAFRAALLGAHHPLSYPQGGLPGTVAALELEDVKAHYGSHLPRHLAGVLVSTDLQADALLAELQDLAALPVEAGERPPLAADGGTPSGRQLYLVDKAGAAQSSLRIGHPAIPYDALGDFYQAGLANFPLGGVFNSRLNLKLREARGYTYGVRSAFTGGPELGSFGVSSEVNRDATAAAVSETLQVLEAYAAEGMSEPEFDFLRNAIGQRDALRYETPFNKLELLTDILQYDLPLDYRNRQNQLLRTVDRESLNAVIARQLRPDTLSIVVVGDLASIRPGLEALGLPIRLLDEDGFERPGKADSEDSP